MLIGVPCGDAAPAGAAIVSTASNIELAAVETNQYEHALTSPSCPPYADRSCTSLSSPEDRLLRRVSFRWHPRTYRHHIVIFCELAKAIFENRCCRRVRAQTSAMQCAGMLRPGRSRRVRSAAVPGPDRSRTSRPG